MKKLSIILSNDGLTSTDINIGSVNLNVNGILLQFDVNTFNPTVKNGFINFTLYIDTELFHGTTEELVNSTLFYDVSGSVWIEDSPYDIEYISLAVKENGSTSLFPLTIN